MFDAGTVTLIGDEIMGVGIAGTDDADVIHANADGSQQIHIFAKGGDDVIRMDFSGSFSSSESGDVINGHHVYGGSGADEFRFENISDVIAADVRVVGRIDDLDVSRDTIWIDNNLIDLHNLPQTVRLDDGTEVEVRIVEYEIPNPSGDEALSAQQFLLIGDNIMYAIEGARSDPSSPSGEERHFFDWTVEPDDLETVEFRDQVNYVPADAYDTDDIDRVYDVGRVALSCSEGNDIVYFNKLGSGSGNKIYAAGGDDVVNAGQGNDTVNAGAGDDLVAGGLDNDLLLGRAGDDTLWGGSEDDTLIGNRGKDVLYGGDGNDRLNGGNGADEMSGGRGNDTYRVDDRNDVIREHQNEGYDHVFSSVGFSLRGHSQHVEDLTLLGSKDVFAIGNSQDNVIRGNSGDNRINGAWGDDTLMGRRGDDTFRDDQGNDLMVGGLGSDTFIFQGDFGQDTISDFDGSGEGDVIDLSSLSSIVSFEDLLSNHLTQEGDSLVIDDGQGNTITLTGVEASELSENDFIFSNAVSRSNDILKGGSGRDKLVGGKGNDTIKGGGGEDTLFGQADHDRLQGQKGDDKLNGNKGNDTVKGGNGQDTLNGGRGDDLLKGGNHDDKLIGGKGDDTLAGGDGADTFVFNSNINSGDDVITDFQNGDDVIRITGRTEFDDLTIQQVDGDTVITWSNGSITLDGVIGEINEDDFVFG